MPPKKSDLALLVNSLPEDEVRCFLLEAATAHSDIALKLQKTRGKAIKEPEWDNFNKSLPQYWTSIPAQPVRRQVEMLEQILACTVIAEDSSFNRQLERIAADTMFSAFHQPWYASSYPPRRLSRMAELAGCKDAEKFPGVIVRKLIKLVMEQRGALGFSHTEWASLQDRVEGYKAALFDDPFLFENKEVPLETLGKEVARAMREADGARLVGKAVAKRPAATSVAPSAKRKKK